MTDGPPKRPSSSQYAAVLGVPLHLVDGCQTEILKHCPATSDEATKAVRKALRRFQVETYEQGKERGSADATVRLRSQLAEIGPAYLAALARIAGLAGGSAALPQPDLASVAQRLRERGVVATDRDVARLVAVAGLPVADWQDAWDEEAPKR